MDSMRTLLFSLILVTATSTTVPGQSIRGLDHLAYGIHLYEMGQLPEAIAIFRELLTNDPDPVRTAQAQFLIGDIWLKQQQWEQAHAALLTFVTRYPESPMIVDGWVKLTQALEGMEKFEEAARISYYASTMLVDLPEAAMPLMLRAGRAYAALKKPEKAAETFRQVTITFPRSGGAAEAWLELGHMARQASDYSKALQYYITAEHAAGAAGHKGMAAYYQGVIHQAMGEIAHSVEPLRRAIGILPSNTDESDRAKLALASALNRTEQWQDAKKLLDGMTESTAVMLEKASGYAIERDYESAQSILNTVLTGTLTPEQEARALLQLGQIQETAGQMADARESLRRVADILRSLGDATDPNLTRTAHEAAVRVMTAQDPVEAAEYLGYLADQDTEHAVEHLYRAAGYYRTAGRYDQAQHLYSRAAELASGHPLLDDILLARARCLDQAERYSEALAAYGLLADRVPGSPLIDQAMPAQTFIEQHRVIDPATRDLKMLDLSATIRVQAANTPAEDLLRVVQYYIDYGKDYTTAIEKLILILNQQPSAPVEQESRWLLAVGHDYLAQTTLQGGMPEQRSQHLQTAVRLYNEFLDRYPDAPQATESTLRRADLSLSLVSDAKQRAAQAKSLFEPLLNNPEVRERVLFRLGSFEAVTGAGVPEPIIREGIAHFQTLAEEFSQSLMAEEALFKAGAGLYRLNEFDGARTLLNQHRTLYTAARYTPDVLDLLAELDLRENRYTAAALRYKELMERFWYSPIIARRHLAMGDAFLQSGHFQEALESYRHVLDDWLPTASGDSATSSETLEQIVTRLGAAYDSLGAPGGITETLQRLNDQLPVSISRQPIHYALGESYRSVHEPTLAIQEFTTAGALPGPLQRPSQDAAANLLLETGMYAEAVKRFEQLRDTATELPQKAACDARIIIGTYRQSRVDEADKMVKNFEDTNKKSVGWEAYRWQFQLEKGKVYYSVKNYKRAQDTFEKVAEQAGKVEAGAEGLYFLGLTYEARNDKRTLETFFDVTEKYPDHPIAGQANKKLALAYSDQGKNGESVRHYRKAAEHPVTGSRDVEAWLGLISAAYHAGFYEAHLNSIRQYLELFPHAEDRFEKQLEYGNSLIEWGKAAGAQQYFETLMAEVSYEEEAQVQFYYARSIHQQGLLDLASAEYLKVLFYGGDVPLEFVAFSLIQLGEIADIQGRIDHAIGYYSDLLERTGASSQFGLTAQNRIKQLQQKKDAAHGNR